jgi:phosphoribosylformimino-5-aminoimidazole carboxamide ribonucleotide (ProFAR) isomerase
VRRQAALGSLRAWPGGLQLGGGVTTDNAMSWLDAGASHVIVTSFVFREGRLEEDRLKALVRVWLGTGLTRQTSRVWQIACCELPRGMRPSSCVQAADTCHPC